MLRIAPTTMRKTHNYMLVRSFCKVRLNRVRNRVKKIVPKTRFQICVNRVLRHEGGSVDHKADRGGRTSYGISQYIFKVMQKDGLTQAFDVYDISLREAKRAYRKYFWIGWRCNKQPPGFDYMHFDVRINFDVKIGNHILQGKTLEEMRERRDDAYHKIVTRDPSQKVFLTGWLKRSKEVYDHAVADRKNNTPA